MCTSMRLKTDDFYFGRNMDIEYGFNEQVVITPRNYPFEFRKNETIHSHYAIIGMATIMDNYPHYAEAANEKGLCIAGLNFPNYAYYSDKMDDSKINISVFELIPWLLCQCETVSQVRYLLSKTHIVNIPFKPSVPVATLHWHIADKNSSIVLECTKTGMHIYDDPVDVLTNDPEFSFHITNLAQYLNLETGNVQNCFSNKSGIKPFGKGMGSIGLPGDFSPASRFVKAAFLKLNSKCNTDENDSVSQFFHILDSVKVVNGSIKLDNDDESEYVTSYTCCINPEMGVYYYKTYHNNQISAVNMYHEDLQGRALYAFPLVKNQRVLHLN